MNLVKKMIRGIVNQTGVDVIRLQRNRRGVSAFADMQHFLQNEQAPVIFDVGANSGQSVDQFRTAFPKSFIHSFEPSPSTYEKLESHCKRLPAVRTWNCGVGSTDATLTFLENEHSVMSSFLRPSTSSWGNVVGSIDVPVVTLDSFASDKKIDFVHVLKSDTQGYDFEVFKGASRLMKENRIGLVYFEFIFSDMYKNLPSFDEVFRYLSDRNFALVAFYDQHFQDELISWADVLFVSRDFNRKKAAQ